VDVRYDPGSGTPPPWAGLELRGFDPTVAHLLEEWGPGAQWGGWDNNGAIEWRVWCSMAFLILYSIIEAARGRAVRWAVNGIGKKSRIYNMR